MTTWLALLMLASVQQPCLDLAGDISVRGTLSLQHFPGPPNYADVRTGDADEEVFIVTLARPVCLVDGADGFADPHNPVGTVQLVPEKTLAQEGVRSMLGLTVTVSGKGFAAQSGHHHAPLVLMINKAPKPD
jgi:hypothetical protein